MFSTIFLWIHQIQSQAGSDSDQESNDGVGSSRKTHKRARGKVQLPPTTKATDEQFVSHSPIIGPNYGCLPLLKKKRSGGMSESKKINMWYMHNYVFEFPL